MRHSRRLIAACGLASAMLLPQTLGCLGNPIPNNFESERVDPGAGFGNSAGGGDQQFGFGDNDLGGDGARNRQAPNTPAEGDEQE